MGLGFRVLGVKDLGFYQGLGSGLWVEDWGWVKFLGLGCPTTNMLATNGHSGG